MSPEEICNVLKSEHGASIADTVLEASRPYAVVATDAWPKVARFLRDDSRMGFNFLRCISAIDLLADDKLACVYDLMAIPAVSATQVMGVTHEFAVRVVTDRNAPKIPSVADVWPAAEWHEREAFDMMGIEFEGHPDLRRILTWDDFGSFPLRKDYPLRGKGERTNYEVTTRDSA